MTRVAEPSNPTIGSKSMDESFKVLQKKEIFEFLEGSGDQELVQYNGSWYGLPYHSASELDDICRSFGYTGELGGSRWTYVEALMQFAIEQERCSELLSYLLSVEQFTNLNGLSSMDEIDAVHQEIVIAALEKLNIMIRLTRKELVFYNGQSLSPIVPTNLRDLRHLLGTLENLPDARDAEWNDNETGRDVFKAYFFGTWAARLPLADYEFAQKLANYRDLSTFNAFIVEYFTKRVKQVGIELMKEGKKTTYENLYLNIAERMNTASNISCGDVMFILWLVSGMSINTDIQNLIFLIKTTYSMRLYECYNNISVNEDTLYVPTNDVEEVVSIHKADGLYEHVNNLQRLVNGSFFTYPPRVLLRTEENIAPRDRRIVLLEPIYNYVAGLCKDYNPNESTQSSEFTQKLKMCEYLALCLSRTTINTEKEDSGQNRKEKLPTYLGKLQSSAQYAVFDFLNPFYSFCNIQYAYERFDSIIAKKDSSAIPLYQMAMNTKDSLLWNFYALEEGTKPTWKGIHSFISDAIIRISDVQWSIVDELLRTRNIHKDGDSAIADAYDDITKLRIKLYPLKRKDGSGEPHILRFKCLEVLKNYLEKDGGMKKLSELLQTNTKKEDPKVKKEVILSMVNKLSALPYPRSGHSITTQISNAVFPESKTKRKMLKNELLIETFNKQQQYQYDEVTKKFNDIFLIYAKVSLINN